MRRTFPSLFRCIAILLLVTVTNAALAMAAYVCPEQVPDVAMQMAPGTPCPMMDKEKPVHCAEHKAGTKAAPEQGGVPALVPAAIPFAIPLPRPRLPDMAAGATDAAPADAGADPPWLRTLRLRI